MASADKEFVQTEIEKYKPGKEIYLRMKVQGNKVVCEYSLNNKTWTQAGEVLDSTILSTRVAGGFVGTYFGLYAYANSPAVTEFDWASHIRID